MNQHKPGDTITPGQNGNHERAKTDSADKHDDNLSKDVASGGWQFSQDKDDQPATHSIDNNDKNDEKHLLSWDASEFIAHEKSVTWYVYLSVITIVAAGLIFFLTKDKVTTAVILLAGLIFGYFSARKSNKVNYQLDITGIKVGQKFYNYNSFKSFSVVNDNNFSSIVFIPLKRFMPQLSLFYDPKDEKKIMDILSDKLPLEQRRDIIDSLMRRIRY